MARFPLSVVFIRVGPGDEEISRDGPRPLAVLEVDDGFMGETLYMRSPFSDEELSYQVPFDPAPTAPVVIEVKVPSEPNRIAEFSDGRVAKVWDLKPRVQQRQALRFADGSTRVVTING